MNQILVRRRIERIAKQTQEVITRQASLSGDFYKVERQLIRLVDEHASPTQALANILAVTIVSVHDGRHSTSKLRLAVRRDYEAVEL